MEREQWRLFFFWTTRPFPGYKTSSLVVVEIDALHKSLHSPEIMFHKETMYIYLLGHQPPGV